MYRAISQDYIISRIKRHLEMYNDEYNVREYDL